jgi:hypothetical protein
MRTIKPGVLKDMHKQLAKYAFLHKLDIPVWEYTRGMFLGDKYEMEDFKSEIKSGDYWYAAYDSAHFFKASVTVPEEMDGKENRAAKFVSAVCCVWPDGDTLTVRGECHGTIGFEPLGEGGFGYDPVFMVGEKSYSQMTAQEKDAVSHRGEALRKLKVALEEKLNK